jgi:DNA-binding transcriptional LysR family regulator
VRSGDYALGLCPALPGDKDLVVRELAREPMVIVPSRLEPLVPTPQVDVWAIETQSLTWEAIHSRLPRVKRATGFSIQVVSRLESFTALVQVARAGFASSLVPLGVARELGVPSQRLVHLGDLSRPIAAVGRRTAFKQAAVCNLLDELAKSFTQMQSAGFST